MLSYLAAVALLAPSHPRLVNIVWDGAADWVVDKLLAEGKLPNVARLRRNGISATAVIPAWPSKTAVGHASIFTGTWPDRHGVTNNSTGVLPISTHSLEESRSGFDSASLQAEPIWVTIAKAGRKAVALSAAGSYPPGRYRRQIQAAGGNPKNFVEFSGFELNLEPSHMIRRPGTLTLAGTQFWIRAIDDPQIAVRGFDTVEISGAGHTIRLRPSPANPKAAWPNGIKVMKDGNAGMAQFRLWSLDPKTGGMNLYVPKMNAVQGTQSAEENARYMRAYGGFHDDFDVYEQGVLGDPLWRGGNGEAEQRILELVQHDANLLKRSFAYGWKTYRPDVLFHYQPMTDACGHSLMAFLDPDTAKDERLRKAMWKVYAKVYEIEDDWLGYILDSVDKNTVVALMSDHGMAGITQEININRLLQDAGLCVYREDGKVDWSKSRAAVPDWGDFFVVVNSTRHRGGIVPVSQEAAVVAEVKAALLEARPLVTGVFTTQDAQNLGIGGDNGGSVYFELAPGLNPRSSAKAPLLRPASPGFGNHGFWPYRRTMNSILYAAGGSLPKGRVLPIIRQIDIWPTLSKAIGLPAPKDATGVSYLN